MNQIDLIKTYKHSNKCTELFERSKEAKDLIISNLSGSLKAIYISIFLKKSENTNFFIFQSKENALIFLNDLKNLNVDNTFFFTDKKHLEDSVEITKLLQSLDENKNNTVISFEKAICQKLPNHHNLEKDLIKICVKQKINISSLENEFINIGFEQVDFTTRPGEFSIRGFIIDVFSFGNENPYRIVLSSNNVENIMVFNAETQLSTDDKNNIIIAPNIYDPKASNENYIFSYLKKTSTIWIEDFDLLKKNVEKEIIQDLESFYKINISNKKNKNSLSCVAFKSSIQKSFNKNIILLEKEIEKNKTDFINIIAIQSDSQKKRFKNIFNKLKYKEDYHLINLNISQGFIDYDNKISIYTDHEIFNRFHKKKYQQIYQNKKIITLKELNKLEKGDYITHYDHGVGIYDGLIKINNENKKQEVLKIKYKNEGVLYVSIHSIHKISKYKSKEDEGKININELGNPSWKKLKNKVKSKVKELAFDLVELYAERKNTKGFSYSKDSYLQNELESSFIFEDTIDQATSTDLIKKDMENSFPMDRLICGDVGFGKTELAIRASFKAIADNKQVGILVPTTVLALQHYKTFTDRLIYLLKNVLKIHSIVLLIKKTML